MAGPAVDTEHAVYSDLKERWMRCRDCSEGSDAVKEKGIVYLPPLDSHKRESIDQRLQGSKYDEYKLRALFYNATGRTIQGLSGAIFQKAPSVVPEAAEKDITDITLTGENIELFSLYVTKEYLTTGRTGILVDMSTTLSTTPRPYWVCYKAEEIVNWRFEKMGGDQELSLVVLREPIDDVDPDDEFKVKTYFQYRVLRLQNGIYTQQIYVPVASTGTQKIEYEGQAVITPTRKGKSLDFIPFSLPWTVNAPPLIDLVDVNLAHYRASADLKHGLHFTALPTPWVSGLTDNSGKPLSIGSGAAWVLDVNGKAGMLEFTGHGLGAIRTDIQDMEHMLATLGARLLEAAPHYAETALSVSMRHSSDYATLRTIAQVVEQQLTFALKIHNWWLGNDALVTASKADIQLNKVFFDQSVSADELRALLLALQGSSISYKTFYARLSNTGWTREGIDAEAEKLDITSDGDLFKPPAKPGLQQPDPKSTAPGSQPVPKPGSGGN